MYQYWSPTNPKIGWGHSTWQEAIKVAESAGVKTLVLFHHDPTHSDDQLDEIARHAQVRFSGALVAREGMELHIPSPVLVSV
jgi:ribonuclease Z